MVQGLLHVYLNGDKTFLPLLCEMKCMISCAMMELSCMDLPEMNADWSGEMILGSMLLSLLATILE